MSCSDLRADSNWINQGQCTTIRWDVDNIKAVYFIDGGNSQGVSGQETRQVTVNVTEAAHPGPSINTSHINMVRSGTVVYSDGPANGSFEDCPLGVGLYDYELQAFGNGQTAQRVSVNVVGPEPR